MLVYAGGNSRRTARAVARGASQPRLPLPELRGKIPPGNRRQLKFFPPGRRFIVVGYRVVVASDVKINVNRERHSGRAGGGGERPQETLLPRRN